MFRLFKWLDWWWSRLKGLFQWLTGFFPGNIMRPFKILPHLKNWLFLKPRILKILLSVKTWLVLALGASNLFVMSFVFKPLFHSNHREPGETGM